MTERRFAGVLQGKGKAALMRESVSQALRESAIQSRPKLVEPVDYENFVVKNKVLLHNDPQRDMLNFPHDDVLLPPPNPVRKIRTAVSTVPANAVQEVSSLMVKECLKTYTSELQMVKFKYQAYAGSYQQLPNVSKKEPLQEHIFEIDADVEERDDDTLSHGFMSSITKKGWLLKGPSGGKDNIISFSKFKKRHFVLKQQSDFTYTLEIYKDDKKSDAKETIFLDLASEVVKNPKKGKFCFEIKMNNKSPSCLLAAESEAEANDWITTLNKVINAADTASQTSRESIKEENTPSGTPDNYKESSINHPVVKDVLWDLNTDSYDSITDASTEPVIAPRRPPPPPPPSSSSMSAPLPQPTPTPLLASIASPSLPVVEVTDSSLQVSESGIEFKEPLPVAKVVRRKKTGYCRETDSSLAKARQEARQNLFGIYPDMRRNVFDEDIPDEEETVVDVFPQQYADKFLIRLEELKFHLQLNLADEGKGNKKCNPEPFFLTFALYDAREGKKISEDFHLDPNEPEIRGMIPTELFAPPDRLSQAGKEPMSPDGNSFRSEWVAQPSRQGIFSIVRRHQDIYLVARIEKVLQGPINQCLEPYLKGSDPKTAVKQYRQMRQFCSHIGHYRMPFAWSAIALSPDGAMPRGRTKLPLYRQENSKFSEEEVIKLLNDLKKPEKKSKLQEIPGDFKIFFDQIDPEKHIDYTLTPSLVPVKPFSEPAVGSLPTLEIEEFVPDDARLCSPFNSYVNNLYVRPMSLKYDGQKAFAKARNIACCIELRDSDEEGTVPLKRIYGRPGVSVLTPTASTTVLHHNQIPDFMEEVKICLPVQLKEKHHLFFRFYHVSCEASKAVGKTSSIKKKEAIEMPVGYAWMPLLQEGRIVTGDKSLAVAATVPALYLNYDSLGKSTGGDLKWVDGGKPLFKFNLNLVSTVYTKDQHLHNFFFHCQKVDQGGPQSIENNVNKVKLENGDCGPQGDAMHIAPLDLQTLLNGVKSLLAVEVSTYVRFLPTLLNQLFQLLGKTVSEDIAVNSVRVLIHVVSGVHEAEKQEALEKYVKYMFRPEPASKTNKSQKTVHEELAKHLNSILRPANTDPLVVLSFLKHAWFFFEVLLKSMTLYLIDSDRVKMPRNERFAAECQYRIQHLLQAVTLHIIQKSRDHKEETKNANHSLANFVKNCFTLMDRGYVFKMISKYIENFNPGDSKTLHDIKFEFLRIVCSHEHFIPLSLPLMRRGMVKNFKELFKTQEYLRHDYCLSDEFRQNHYLVGLLLFELRLAMTEQRAIRRSAITVLRNQLAKHSFDDRYATLNQQGRIAALYLPLIGVLLDSKNLLLQLVPNSKSAPAPAPQNGEISSRSDVSKSQMSLSKGQSSPVPGTPETKKKESAVFAMISGTGELSVAVPHNPNELSVVNSTALNGSNTSLASDDSGDKEISNKKDGKIVTRMPSKQTTYMSRYDKLDQTEIRDLLVCFMYILKHLPEDILLGWFNNSSEIDIIDFFSLLELCLKHFQYQGRKKIVTLSMIGGQKSSTMPTPLQNQRGRPISLSSQRTPSQYGDMISEGFHTPSHSDADAMIRALQEANISTEIGLIVLDVLSLFCTTFKKDLEARGGDNNMMHTVFQLYLGFLRSSQSENLQKHMFGAWRAFIKKFQAVLFKGSADMCGELCYEILKCCNSKLNSTRREACALLYLLMRSNFEFSNRKSFTRVHLQVIISVSKLIGSVVGLSTSRFQESLAIVNNYANSDKSIQKTPFPGEVRDLTKRIRTVLMATAQMKENENDPELLVDLQYSLAKSYASTPELRKTWLDAMAKLHIRRGDFSEAGFCYIHIAALIAEYLKRRGKLKSRSYPQGCSSFHFISPNIVVEEADIKDDSGMQDVQYTEETLVEFLEKGAEYLEKAQRFEILGDIYKLIIPIYEKLRNFKKLETSYQYLAKAYGSVIEVMRSGKRLLGKYYMVTLYGQTYFEDEDKKEYIYKEPKVTTLTEIRERLHRLFSDKFGRENVHMINDSKKISPNELDSKYAYIQIIYVTPYFEENDLVNRVTDFERNNNVRNFMYELPFTRSGKEQGSIEEQHKRRFIITTTHSFPYVKKRIEVKEGGRKEIVLTPIEVAIDEMRTKVSDLREAINSPVPDKIGLQLKLQGGVSTQVNAGPLAYAEAFLNREKISQYPADQCDRLKAVFRDFVTTCKDALDLNAKLIATEQKEYHESLKAGFQEIAERLSNLLGEKIVPLDWMSNQQRQSMTFIGGLAGSSSA
ncbi:dedicator of cytokinesis protein 9-like isoform X6 [Biomphalaria glabrata]|uniref:Dedicator of cytokinesis protein 9-like isoform X6 n=1 Tax=Biomphalaria glabrata TaxID=6526 RepID=A0A9W2Z0V3_BIOGL|nr:dedicator of cytokinesis protein 9-like isoform X6 [Biomphalaria glabrata]